MSFHFLLSRCGLWAHPDHADRRSYPLAPTNPYGRGKLFVEAILAYYATAYGMRYACLRYFNAAGADRQGEWGECRDPEPYLMPLVLQTASGRLRDIAIYGRNYPTRDGACAREYVHVSDLAQTHHLALDYLIAGGPSCTFNLGRAMAIL